MGENINMIKQEAKLVENLFGKPEMAATRDGYGKGLVEAGERDERVVVLCAEKRKLRWM